MPNYDADTQKFMSDASPTRDADPRPTAPQSPDVTPGNTAASFPSGWSSHIPSTARTAIRAATSIQGGANPVEAIARAVAKVGLKSALKAEEKTASVKGVLSRICDLHGTAWYDWEPETIVQTLGLTEIEGGDLEVIQAVQTIMKTNQVHESWNVFEKVGQALNGNDVDFATVQPLRPDEVAYTVKVVNSLRSEPYVPEVLAYMAACAKHSGVVFLPKEWFPEGCQEFLDDMGNDLGLKAVVERRYAAKEKGADIQEDIQLAGLTEIEEYLYERS